MKTKLLIICLLLVTSQVFADDFDKYEREISRIKMTCADSNYGINTFSTDGANLYYSKCRGCPMEELYVGHERAFDFIGRISDLKKKDGENTYLVKYTQKSYRRVCYQFCDGIIPDKWGVHYYPPDPPVIFDVYVNFQKRKVIANSKEWDCY